VTVASSRSHALRMLFMTVLLRPFGNLSLAFGMKHLPQMLALSPLPFLVAFANPFVSGGIVLLVVSMLTRMALMSMADLSVILPLTAVGYIFSTFLGKVFLGEQVSVQHWMGTLLVFLGVVLVSTTSLSSTFKAQRSTKPTE
jgi:drug/metabolite transporter (DMT)-like permease